jgi:hypothetical protein
MYVWLAECVCVCVCVYYILRNMYAASGL